MSVPPTALESLRRSIDLLWGTGPRPTRGPKPGLTLDKIVAAAIDVADRDGVDGLTMRRVAAELGVGAMSLYRYVPGKDELLVLMLDKLCELPADAGPTADAGWRTVVDSAARDSYRMYLRHPWLLQVNWTRPVLGPGSLGGMEMLVGNLAGLGLTDQERVAVVVMIDGYVTGAARVRIQHAALPAETGLTDEEFWRQQVPALAKAMESGRYPAMAALTEDAFSMGWEETFEFGLARLLDGLAVLIEARRTGSA